MFLKTSDLRNSRTYCKQTRNRARICVLKNDFVFNGVFGSFSMECHNIALFSAHADIEGLSRKMSDVLLMNFLNFVHLLSESSSKRYSVAVIHFISKCLWSFHFPEKNFKNAFSPDAHLDDLQWSFQFEPTTFQSLGRFSDYCAITDWQKKTTNLT